MLSPHTIPTVTLSYALRQLLQHPPTPSLPDEIAAFLPTALPTHTTPDPGAWIAWCLAGLPLFHGPRLPPLRTALAQTRRLLTALAMLRASGNLSQAARTLATSRKVLRDNLRRVGLYPWPADLTAEPPLTGPTSSPPAAPTDSSAEPEPKPELDPTATDPSSSPRS